MSFSNWMENIVLNHIFSKAVYSPGPLWLGLCTNHPGEGATGGSCNEVANSNGYTRMQTSSTSWTTAAAGQIANALEIAFPLATGNWGTVKYFVLLNAGTYGIGNVLLYGELTTYRQIISGYQAKFPPSSLIVQLD